MILATLLNIHFSREYVQGFREILQEKPQKTSFYCIKVYIIPLVLHLCLHSEIIVILIFLDNLEQVDTIETSFDKL